MGISGENIAYQSFSVPDPVSNMPSPDGALSGASHPTRPAGDAACGLMSGARTRPGGRPRAGRIVRESRPCLPANSRAAAPMADRGLASQTLAAEMARDPFADRAASAAARSRRRPVMASTRTELASARTKLGDTTRHQAAPSRTFPRPLLARAEPQLAHTGALMVAGGDAHAGGTVIFVRQAFKLASFLIGGGGAAFKWTTRLELG
jgi:hypothetical protein